MNAVMHAPPSAPIPKRNSDASSSIDDFVEGSVMSVIL